MDLPSDLIEFALAPLLVGRDERERCVLARLISRSNRLPGETCLQFFERMAFVPGPHLPVAIDDIAQRVDHREHRYFRRAELSVRAALTDSGPTPGTALAKEKTPFRRRCHRRRSQHLVWIDHILAPKPIVNNRPRH